MLELLLIIRYKHTLLRILNYLLESKILLYLNKFRVWFCSSSSQSRLQVLTDKPQLYFYYIFDIIFPYNEPSISGYNSISLFICKDLDEFPIIRKTLK